MQLLSKSLQNGQEKVRPLGNGLAENTIDWPEALRKLQNPTYYYKK
jgi:hypothetical protein